MARGTAHASVPERMALSRRLALLVAALGVVSATSCLSPTLPLPPPSRPDKITGPDSQGFVTIEGSVLPNTVVFVENSVTRLGSFQGVGADGRYLLTLQAELGTELWLWYARGSDESPVTTFTVGP
jgi:hypothetical protein